MRIYLVYELPVIQQLVTKIFYRLYITLDTLQLILLLAAWKIYYHLFEQMNIKLSPSTCNCHPPDFYDSNGSVSTPGGSGRGMELG